MPDFQYSLNASTIRPTPILEKITIAAETGYGAIELWFDEIEAYVREGGSVKDVRKALDDGGLAVPTVIYLAGWFDTFGEEYEAAIDQAKRRIQVAAELGAPFVIASPPLGTADYRVGAERYRQLLEIGDSFGVFPAMEFLGFVEQLNTIEDALEVMNLCGHHRATTVLDPFHIFRGGGTIDSIAKMTSDQIAVCHFNDTVNNPPREQQHDPDRVMPGDGQFDLRGYLELLREIGYDRWLSLELFREDLWTQDPREVAAVGLEKMRAVVE